jgi:tetratricopeptide (TPR) repeat protein
MTKRANLIIFILLGAGAGPALSGCSTMRKVFATDQPQRNQAPIANPFVDYYLLKAQGIGAKDNIVLRTKKGDRSVEVELPNRAGELSDLVVPMSPAFKEAGRGPAGDGTLDNHYQERRPSISDRELTSGLPQGLAEDEGRRREVETGLGVIPSEDSAPAADQSYLAGLDHVKQLYRLARYEAAMLELDEMLRAYPTDPRLYEMRGTLFDRLGRPDLALKSWQQSLRYDPQNPSLQRFVERKLALDERKLALDERKLALDERQRAAEPYGARAAAPARVPAAIDAPAKLVAPVPANPGVKP